MNVAQILLDSGFKVNEDGYYIAVSHKHNFLIATEMLDKLKTTEEKQDFLLTVYQFVGHRVPNFKIKYMTKANFANLVESFLNENGLWDTWESWLRDHEQGVPIDILDKQKEE